MQIRGGNGITRFIFPGPPRPRSSSSSDDDDDDPSPHEGDATSYGVIYVNELARRAMVDEKKPRFPAGSVIVREKLAQEADAAPQVLVVMVKREQGFNLKAKDWEFLTIDGQLSKVEHREKTGSCRDCHNSQKDRDFVFRSYLTEEMRGKQK
ncbi:MAG: cytochrome P460 family protein [Pyrinomonadaceae bacterium]|nr:cytochrome P460 family protein [Pyrinomonadaceae bacterium]